MRKIILASIFLAGSLSAMADDYQYLTVAQSGSEKSITLATIQKITFDTQAGNVVVHTTEGQVLFPISEMEKMYFSATIDAVKALPLQSEALKLERGELKVKGDGLLRIYGANGSVQRMAKVNGETSVSLDNLPKGTYIVNLGNQTIKIKK